VGSDDEEVRVVTARFELRSLNLECDLCHERESIGARDISAARDVARGLGWKLARRLQLCGICRSISQAQKEMLLSVWQGHGPTGHLTGRSLHGGVVSTRATLTKRGFLTPDGNPTERGLRRANEMFR
jgi:hypothetical protein